VRRVVSGGQTGVDRAALDAAWAAGIRTGGWCPQGRRAEDGMIPGRYPLQETPSPEYAQRTAWNVRDSDGTLVLTGGPAAGGTQRTIEEAIARQKPLLQVDLQTETEAQQVATIRRWLADQSVGVLNVAGPRESETPGIYRRVRRLLAAVFEADGDEPSPSA
jgi:hypothetical protein